LEQTFAERKFDFFRVPTDICPHLQNPVCRKQCLEPLLAQGCPEQTSWKEERLAKAHHPAAAPLHQREPFRLLSVKSSSAETWILTGMSQSPQTKISVRRNFVISPLFDVLSFLSMETNHAQEIKLNCMIVTGLI